jgi:hypothetical protein
MRALVQPDQPQQRYSRLQFREGTQEQLDRQVAQEASDPQGQLDQLDQLGLLERLVQPERLETQDRLVLLAELVQQEILVELVQLDLKDQPEIMEQMERRQDLELQQ